MTERATRGGEPAAYLIVLRHVVVAQDIAMTVAEFAPEAPVLTVASVAEALPALDGLDRLALAFVAEAPRVFEGSPLAREIAARGGRVVLIGEAAEAEGEAMGFAVLTRPFTTADILARVTG